MLVAPYYGVAPSAKRAGWSPKFVERIKACEYPQYMWELTPLKKPPEESVLRFDHIQPVSLDSNAYESTDYCLSAEGKEIIFEWLDWFLYDRLSTEDTLGFLREELLAQLKGKDSK